MKNSDSVKSYVLSVGEDFVDFGPILLDYFGGNRRIDVLEFQITIQDDDIPEPTERFQIHGTNTQNLLFTDPFMTVTILDDDGGMYIAVITGVVTIERGIGEKDKRERGLDVLEWYLIHQCLVPCTSTSSHYTRDVH